jgi:type I restriction enzyme M protein
MLDDATKKRINTLRQILVGKLPDPKAQVEQITNGLIYKFMNDMDEQSVSMGGKSTYFSGKFQKYSWKNLLDTKTSGVEKIKLYSDAIEQMYTNENLPELFREIFKNSFLPFKEPSTLNMFLKEINEFNYSNSEKLGDAFEYLLSFMGSQGDAGQFRTPRHIIDFIVEIVNPQKNETILDPACGTAGFLISSYKHILKQNTKKNLGDGLTASDRKKIGENLNGYDISPDMVKMSLVNMYLHKFTNPKINEYDTLSSEERWNEYYDVILANPPFFSPTGGVIPHNRFGVNSNRAEILFVDYINEHLKPNGRAGIIVPEGVVFQSNTQAYKQLRKNLINSSLLGIISLPAGVFQPYSGVKTSILILDKKNNKEFSDIFYIDLKNDGYSLNTNRKPINKNDLPEVKKIILSFLAGKKIDKKFLVNKDTILASEDLKVKPEVLEENQSVQLVSMSEVIEVKNGYAFKSADMIEEKKQDFLPVLKIGNISKQGEIDDGFKYHKYKSEFEKFLIPNNSIVIAMTGATVGKVAINNNGQKLLLNQRVGKIEIKKIENINNNYLFYLLKSEKFYNYCQSNAVGGAQGNISTEDITKFKIPLPSIETQNKIVEELDGYQKIIDGCRQVVENYKPSIVIDPTWEMIELGDIGEIISGGTPNSKIDDYWNGDIEWLTLVDLPSNEPISYIKTSKRKITRLGFEKSSAKIIPINSVIVSTRATIGRVGINEIEVTTNQGFKSIAINQKKNIPEYIAIQIYLLRNYLKSIATGGTFGEISKSNFEKIKIPIPSIEIQNDIVRGFKEEISIVGQNQKLLKKFEYNIQNRVSKIWSN